MKLIAGKGGSIVAPSFEVAVPHDTTPTETTPIATVAGAGPRPNWFSTLPGLLTAAAGFFTALTALIAAFSGAFSLLGWRAHPEAAEPASCLPGFVRRLAIPDDQVCVTEEARRLTAADNQLGGSRRNAAGGPYGADTCQSGYVWREAFPEDRVCVLPETRDKTQKDNALAATRVKR